MKHAHWFIPAIAALLLAGCSSVPVEELRSKLAAANVEVSVKTTINKVEFFTRTQEVGQSVATGGAGVLGAFVGTAIYATGRVDPIAISEGYSHGVAGAIKSKIARTRSGAVDSYRLEVTDAAILKTVDASGSLYSLGYSVALGIVNAADNKAINTVICSGTGPDRLSEAQWRESQGILNAMRKQIIDQCSNEFIAKLAPAAAFASARQQRKK